MTPRLVGILTVSDRGARGEADDRSGPLIASMLAARPSWQVARQALVADERDEIADILRAWCADDLHLILTTGGTGMAPRDVTPEATLAVIERQAPGIAEALRADGLQVTLHAMLSRGVAGTRGQTLIINLPGSPKAVKEGLNLLLPVLPHALDLLRGAAGSERDHRQV